MRNIHSNINLFTACPKLCLPTLLKADQALCRPVHHSGPLSSSLTTTSPPLFSSETLSNTPTYTSPTLSPQHPHLSTPSLFLTLSPHPLWMRGSLLWGGSQLDYQASVAVSTWLVEDGLRQSTQSILSPKKIRLKSYQLRFN